MFETQGLVSLKQMMRTINQISMQLSSSLLPGPTKAVKFRSGGDAKNTVLDNRQ